MQSWALWLAEALGMPYTCLAVNGARAPDALARQVPRLSGEYELGCVYLGVNDVRSPDWQPKVYEEALDGVMAAVASESATQMMLKLPPSIGRPPAPRRAIERANRTIQQAAERHGAIVVDLTGLQGAELVMPDTVHLTARGEAQLALRACQALGTRGFAVDDSELRDELAPLGLRARLRYATGAGALAELRDLRRRTLERAQRELR